MVTDNQVGEVIPEPSQAEPPRTYTSEELTQILTDAKQQALQVGLVQGRAEVQRGKATEVKELRQRIAGLEAENKGFAEIAKVLDTVRDRDPELYEAFQEAKRSAELATREKTIEAREQNVAMSAEETKRAQSMKDWGGHIAYLVQEAKVDLKDLDIVDDLADMFAAGEENPLNWYVPQSFPKRLERSIERAKANKGTVNETVSLKKEIENLRKELGKVKEDTEVGTPKVSEGTGGGTVFTESQIRALDPFEKAKRAKEIAAAYAKGAVKAE